MMNGTFTMPMSPVELFYQFVRPMGQRTTYLNLGYWKDAPADVDDASAALARLVAETAQLGPDDEVLDAGCGFADQDVQWVHECGVKHIVALNNSRHQLERARTLVDSESLGDAIELEYGSATKLTYDAHSFDKVVALESALHFQARTDFFNEAYRVLRHGGRLVLTDLVPAQQRQRDVRNLLMDLSASMLWQIPPANLVPPSLYAEQLKDAGFIDVEVQTITEHVLQPFAEHISELLNQPETRVRLGPVLHAMWSAVARDHSALTAYDYVLASARKPELPV